MPIAIKLFKFALEAEKGKDLPKKKMRVCGAYGHTHGEDELPNVCPHLQGQLKGL